MQDHANVGFFYSAACPLSCNFCCHTAEVVGPGRLTPDALAPVIADFARQPSVARFFFSGGDPFVHIKDVLRLIGRCRESGIRQPFHIVTAGFWANTDSFVEKILSQLRELEVELHLSYDTEHAWFVPREKILSIADWCARLGVSLKILALSGTRTNGWRTFSQSSEGW